MCTNPAPTPLFLPPILYILILQTEGGKHKTDFLAPKGLFIFVFLFVKRALKTSLQTPLLIIVIIIINSHKIQGGARI